MHLLASRKKNEEGKKDIKLAESGIYANQSLIDFHTFPYTRLALEKSLNPRMAIILLFKSISERCN